MDAPLQLPARLFLLAYHPDKHRLTGHGRLGLIMRAAALAELSFAGHLSERNGRVSAAGDPRLADPMLADPVLAAVLTDIAGGRPRRWQHWVAHRSRKCPDLVRDQLVDAGIIRAEKRKVLGLFTLQTITLRDPRSRSRLAETARRVLRGGEPVDRLDRRDAAMVALAAAGQLNHVVGRAQRRDFRRRLASLGEQTGPPVDALRKAVQAQQTAVASG